MGQSPDSKYYSEEENGLPFLQAAPNSEEGILKIHYVAVRPRK
jgi:hypothetical protein